MKKKHIFKKHLPSGKWHVLLYIYNLHLILTERKVIELKILYKMKEFNTSHFIYRKLDI